MNHVACGFSASAAAPASRFARADRTDDAVGADAEPAVADRGDLRGRELVLALGVTEEHEIVAGALPLGEPQIERHGLQSMAAWRASSAPLETGSAASIVTASRYRLNQLTCRLRVGASELLRLGDGLVTRHPAIEFGQGLRVADRLACGDAAFDAPRDQPAHLVDETGLPHAPRRGDRGVRRGSPGRCGGARRGALATAPARRADVRPSARP